MASEKITFIVTCKGRLGHLRRSLPALVTQPRSRVIVVDYDCPDGTASWVRRAHPSAQVVAVHDRPIFNLCHARNEGAAAASTPWLCFIDADVVADQSLAETLEPLLARPHYLFGDPPSARLNGTIILAKDDFVRIGGYDEVFEGWGWEDFDIRERLDLIGAEERPFASALLKEIDHADGERTRFHEHKAKDLNAKKNLVYMMAKLNLMRLEGSELPEPVRRDLYATVGKNLLADPRSKEIELTVTLPTRRVYNTNVVEERTLRMKLRVDPVEPQTRAAPKNPAA